MQSLTGISDNGYGYVSDSYTTQATTYNVNGQLASMGWTGGAGGVNGSIAYGYSANQNNGQITTMTDNISGETVTYQYDALKRLILATSTPNSGTSPAAWNETYAYDGFGNLTSKIFNGGGNPVPGIDPLTNHLTTGTFDLNGNMTAGFGGSFAYDVSNRMTSAVETGGGTEYFQYGADNKQVYRIMADGTKEEFTFWGAQGEKLGVYGPWGVPLRANVYFAGRTIWADGAPAYLDRLGTNRASGARFRPYGDEITATSNDREKFGTYTRDSYTGLDYADQRWFTSTYARFNTPDPFGGSANPANPLSWNRYVYTLGDPINGSDPTGLCDDGDAMANGDYDYSIGDAACPVLSVVDNGVVSDDGNVTFSATATASAASPSSISSAIGGFLSKAAAGFGSFMTAASNNPFVQAVATAATIIPAFVETGNTAPAEAAAEEAAAGIEQAGTAIIQEVENTLGTPSFLGQASGPAIPVPAGAVGPATAANGSGSVFTGGAGGNGLAGNVNGVRVMDPTATNPGGYVNYGSTQANGGWQTVNPYSGQSVGKTSTWWHIPLGPLP